MEKFGDVRIDEFAWMRDVETDPSVKEHLNAENAYTEAQTAHLSGLRDVLFNEIRSRVQETDLSVPLKDGPWEYLSRTEEGFQHARHYRRLAATDSAPAGDEILLLDENELAAGHEAFSLGTFSVSLDHRLLAYAIDTDGDEIYELRIKDLDTGEHLPDVVAETAGGGCWAATNRHFCYLTLDEIHRPNHLWIHELGADPSTDTMCWEEDDERFYLGVGMSSTDEWLIASADSAVSSEVRIRPAADPLGEWAVVEARRPFIEYDIDHHRAVDGTERFLIVTNDGDEHFRLLSAPVSSPQAANWKPVLSAEWTAAERASDYPPLLEGVEIFRRHWVLDERADALTRLRIVDLDDAGNPVAIRDLASEGEAVYSMGAGANAEYDTTTLRFGYSSPFTPSSVYDEDLLSGRRTLLKRQPVPGGFDPSPYVCERMWATAPDGVEVPLAVMRRRDVASDGTAAGVLYGYGSYGICADPGFSVTRLSLLERGVVVVFAHPRGGGERGRRWYLDGKFLAKPNTFTDFLAAARFLHEHGIVARDRLVIRGGSAGGLLVGATANLEPDRFRGVVAEVPFVDALTTMLDDSLPLTETEKDEWGDPSEPEYYACMRSYSPFDNVIQGATYPSVLATAGLQDPRVGFWEPAKWVARLRERSGGERAFLLRTEMGAGHGGPTGRYDAWKDEAFVQAWTLDVLGLAE